MPEDSNEADAEIIRAAYGERLRDAFKSFAEALGTGEAPKASQERFRRSIEQTRKARDMAIEALTLEGLHPDSHHAEAAQAGASADGQPGAAAQPGGPAPKPAEPNLADALSAEDQALIQLVLEGTQGKHTR